MAWMMPKEFKPAGEGGNQHDAAAFWGGSAELHRRKMAEDSGRLAAYVASRWINRQGTEAARAAFHTWQYWTNHHYGHECAFQVLGRLCARAERNKLKRGFLGWTKYCSSDFHLQASTLAAERLSRAGTRALILLLKGKTTAAATSAFLCWRIAAARARGRAAAAWGLGRRTAAALARARATRIKQLFKVWRQQSRKLSCIDTVFEGSMRRWKKSSLQWGFSKWAHRIISDNNMQGSCKLLERVLEKWRIRRETSAFHFWQNSYFTSELKGTRQSLLQHKEALTTTTQLAEARAMRAEELAQRGAAAAARAAGLAAEAARGRAELGSARAAAAADRLGAAAVRLAALVAGHKGLALMWGGAAAGRGEGGEGGEEGAAEDRARHRASVRALLFGGGLAWGFRAWALAARARRWQEAVSFGPLAGRLALQAQDAARTKERLAAAEAAAADREWSAGLVTKRLLREAEGRRAAERDLRRARRRLAELEKAEARLSGELAELKAQAAGREGLAAAALAVGPGTPGDERGAPSPATAAETAALFSELDRMSAAGDPGGGGGGASPAAPSSARRPAPPPPSSVGGPLGGGGGGGGGGGSARPSAPPSTVGSIAGYSTPGGAPGRPRSRQSLMTSTPLWAAPPGGGDPQWRRGGPRSEPWGDGSGDFDGGDGGWAPGGGDAGGDDDGGYASSVSGPAGSHHPGGWGAGRGSQRGGGGGGSVSIGPSADGGGWGGQDLAATAGAAAWPPPLPTGAGAGSGEDGGSPGSSSRGGGANAMVRRTLGRVLQRYSGPGPGDTRVMAPGAWRALLADAGVAPRVAEDVLEELPGGPLDPDGFTLRLRAVARAAFPGEHGSAALRQLLLNHVLPLAQGPAAAGEGRGGGGGWGGGDDGGWGARGGGSGSGSGWGGGGGSEGPAPWQQQQQQPPPPPPAAPRGRAGFDDVDPLRSSFMDQLENEMEVHASWAQSTFPRSRSNSVGTAHSLPVGRGASSPGGEWGGGGGGGLRAAPRAHSASMVFAPQQGPTLGALSGPTAPASAPAPLPPHPSTGPAAAATEREEGGEEEEDPMEEELLAALGAPQVQDLFFTFEGVLRRAFAKYAIRRRRSSSSSRQPWAEQSNGGGGRIRKRPGSNQEEPTDEDLLLTEEGLQRLAREVGLLRLARPGHLAAAGRTAVALFPPPGHAHAAAAAAGGAPPPPLASYSAFLALLQHLALALLGGGGGGGGGPAVTPRLACHELLARLDLAAFGHRVPKPLAMTTAVEDFLWGLFEYYGAPSAPQGASALQMAQFKFHRFAQDFGLVSALSGADGATARATVDIALQNVLVRRAQAEAGSAGGERGGGGGAAASSSSSLPPPPAVGPRAPLRFLDFAAALAELASPPAGGGGVGGLGGAGGEEEEEGLGGGREARLEVAVRALTANTAAAPAGGGGEGRAGTNILALLDA